MSIIRNKNDRRVLRTKKRLTDALISLIDQIGFDKITVSSLVKKADVNRATFYLHYYDKYDLLDEIAEKVLSEMAKSLDYEQVNFKINEESAHQTFVNFFNQIYIESDVIRILLTKCNMDVFSVKFDEIVFRFIVDGLDELVPDDNYLIANRELVENYTTQAIVGMVKWWLENGVKYSADYMAKEMMHLAIYGPYARNPFQSDYTPQN